jgi:hypothetical protein
MGNSDDTIGDFNSVRKANSTQSLIILFLVISQIFSFYKIYEMSNFQSRMASELSRVGAMAENANKYAHSHY